MPPSRRALVAAALLATLVSACASEADGVQIDPPGPGGGSSAGLAQPVLARGGRYRFHIYRESGVLGAVSATSSDPAAVTIEKVIPSLAGRDAWLEVRARGAGSAEVDFRVGGELVSTRSLAVAQGNDVYFYPPADGVRAERDLDERVYDFVQVDAASRLELRAAPVDLAGQELVGAGVLGIEAPEGGTTVGFDLDGSADDVDQLSFQLADPGGGEVDLLVGDNHTHTLHVEAVPATDAVALELISPDQATQPIAGDTVCVAARATDAVDVRIYAPRVTWTVGKATATGDRLCYQLAPDQPVTVVRASYGKLTVETSVHMASYDVIAPGAPLE